MHMQGVAKGKRLSHFETFFSEVPTGKYKVCAGRPEAAVASGWSCDRKSMWMQNHLKLSSHPTKILQNSLKILKQSYWENRMSQYSTQV